MGEKIFLKCSAKEKTFSNGGSVINIGIKATDLLDFARTHANERGYVNLTIQKRREVGQYGDTHTVALDTYQPAARQTTADTPDW